VRALEEGTLTAEEPADEPTEAASAG